MTLLLGRQPGLVEFTVDRQRQLREFLAVPDALDRLAEFNYFGVVPRWRARGDPGSVVSQVWSVWIDIDTEQGNQELLALDKLGLLPTFILFSGRGWWGHWRLSSPVSKDQAEMWNRGLIAVVGREAGSDACWDIGRTARLPGSINEKTGKRATVTDLTGLIYAPDDLLGRIPIEEKSPRPKKRSTRLLPEGTLGAAPRLTARAARVAPGSLGGYLCTYCWQRPSWDDAHNRQPEMDRSEVEYAIAKELVRVGLTDDEIVAWFSRNRLPRHSEEARKRGSFRWTRGAIDAARRSVEDERDNGSIKRSRRAHDHSAPSDSPPPPLVGETLHQVGGRAYQRVDREGMLRLLQGSGGGGLSYGVLWRAIQERAGCSVRAAKGNIRCALDFGYVEKRDGRYRLSEKGRRQLEHVGFPRGSEGMEWSAFIGAQPAAYRTAT